jgi:dGTPase
MHDIGHPPFGHAGEDVLDECAQGAGGFNHNSHALRIVTLLERRYPEFPGLNLSREVLAGQSTREKHGAAAQQPRLEVQVVDAADSIAYNAHDADDALELGLLGIDDLLELDLWRNAASLVHQRYHHLEPAARRRAIVHQLIDLFVGDVIEQSQYQLALAAPASSDAVANEREPLVQNSVSYREQKRQFESFLFISVYRHPAVLAERAVAGTALREMFEHFCAHPDALPADSSHRMAEDGIVRVVCDFLASLTDRAALELFSGQ